MSVVYRNLPTSGPAQVALKVRFAPQFVSRFSTRAQRHTPGARGEITGLLYGFAGESVVTVQAFKSFLDRPSDKDGPTSERDRLAEAFESLMAASKADPEVSSLAVVGWYCIRPAGGLLGGDVDFHNLNFYRPTDIALVARPDRGTDLLLEIYSRSVEALLSPGDHLWGALRVETGTTVAGVIEVTMRGKINDDFYLRAYGITNEADLAETLPYWRRALASTAQKISSLKPKRAATAPKIATAKLPEPIGPPPAPRTPAKPVPSTDPPPRSDEGQRAYEAAREASSRTITRPAFQVPAPTNELMTLSSAAPVPSHISAGDPPSVPALRRQPRPSIPWASSALIFALAAGCTFALVYSRGLPGGLSLPQFLKSGSPSTGLGMHLDSQGERLLLSWNRSNSIVSSARDGILRIDDGSRHREVHLEASQVVNGSVLYRPTSDDVTFRLEVHGTAGNTVSESIRVLDSGGSAKTLDLSEPKAQPQAPATQPNLPVPQPVGQTARIVPDPRTLLKREAQVKASPPPAPAPRTVELARNVGDGRAPQPASAPAPTPTTETAAPAANREPAPASTAAENVSQNNSPATQPQPAATAGTSQPANVEPLSPKPERVVQQPAPAPSRPAPATATAAVGATLYVPPQPVKQVLPNPQFIPSAALQNAPRLEVTVQVDAKGKVTAAQLGSNAKMNPALSGAALSAARQWRFKPATLRGEAVPSQHTIVFQFQSRR